MKPASTDDAIIPREKSGGRAIPRHVPVTQTDQQTMDGWSGV